MAWYTSGPKLQPGWVWADGRRVPVKEYPHLVGVFPEAADDPSMIQLPYAFYTTEPETLYIGLPIESE